MHLDVFLHNLHFDIDRLYPSDWEVDWDDGPLPYKQYRNLPAVPLSAEVPLKLTADGVPAAKPDVRAVGHFLWYVYGLTGCSQSLPAAQPGSGTVQNLRRFAPSGGGLYPSELYVYLNIEDLPAGVYHYDAAHHRLLLLRAGNFDAFVAAALGQRCAVSKCFATVFVSTMFWKNFYKYNNFGYRLQGLDAGVLMGQLLEVSKRFGFTSGVYFQFLDRAVNHLLGLSEQEESVYSVIPLSAGDAPDCFVPGTGDIAAVTATALCAQLPAIQPRHYVKSQRIRDYLTLVRANEASMLESTQSFREATGKQQRDKVTAAAPVLHLPPVNRLSYDLAAVCRERYSPGTDFVLQRMSQSKLATVLQEAMASFRYRNDLDGDTEQVAPRVSLYGCFHGVEGVADGAYRYNEHTHTLQQIRLGDHRPLLQQGMSMPTVNLFQVPLCLHVAGERHHLKAPFGYRGYRIQQMEAGMLVQRLLLAAFALEMGGHPLLGFEAGPCDELYQMASQGQTSLIEIPVGPYRTRPQLAGVMHG